MRTLIFVLACLVLVIPCKAETIIVDPNGFGDFDNIQDAINYSSDGDTIEVQPGTYYENVYFYGKAVTLTSTNPNDPNIVAQTIIDGNEADSVITFAWNEDANSVISGFTITNGLAEYGGGICCWDTSPTIKNCIITENNATIHCGGIYGSNGIIVSCNIIGNNRYGLENCSSQIKNCIIENNGGGLQGCNGAIKKCTIKNNNSGGLYKCNGSIEKCSIESNSRTFAGGGVFRCNGVIKECHIKYNNCTGGDGGGLYDCDGLIEKCVIIGNYATEDGGGFAECDGRINRCQIIGNMAEINGGGLYNCEGTVQNCTVINNSASEYGAGIYFGEGYSPTIKNNIIAYNEGEGIYWKYAIPTEFAYNDVWGNSGGDYAGWAVPGEGDISVDPCFAAPGYWSDPCSTPSDPNDDVWGDGDYHLKSGAGRWDANSQVWGEDDVNSLCIDAGDPNSDWSAEFWPHGGCINMGAYGGTPEASMSASDLGNVADLNTDDFVGYRDMMLFTDKWLYETVLLAEDLNRDSLVNFTDFAIFAENWQLSCQASNPNPTNGVIDVSLTADLSWTAGIDATSHDVYFGTSSPPTFIRNQTATIFDPGTMAYNTTYYWRIDEVGPYGKTTGTVWSFTTMGLEASNPHPADGATKVSTTADLSWTADVDATSHDVYFGTNPAPGPDEFQRNQTETTFDPGTIAHNTTYYWRIDEVGPYGSKTTGTVWSFTTTDR